MIGWSPCALDCGCSDEDECLQAPKNQCKKGMEPDTCRYNPLLGCGCPQHPPRAPEKPTSKICYPCTCPGGCNGCECTSDDLCPVPSCLKNP